MIVSYKNKFIGVKGRKAASSSIELSLNTLCGDGDMYNKLREHSLVQNSLNLNFDRMIEGRRFGLKPHARAREIKRKLFRVDLLTIEQWENFFKFTIERHPYDKVVSLYYYLIKRGKGMPFESYMENGKFKKCYNFPLYTDSKENVMVDYIILYEKLKEGIEYIEEKIGKKIELFNENQGKFKDRKTREELLTDNYKNLIYKTFKKEFDLHGYEK